MPVPVIYRDRNPPLVNYDFQDILTDAGYVTLYGLSDDADATSLIRSAVESTDIVKHGAFAATGADVEAFDIDFDFEFASTQYVKGVLYGTFSYGVDGSAANAATAYLKVTIIHYDGSTETTIGAQATTDTVTNPANTAANFYRTTVAWDIDKKFKKGDILRVTVKYYGNSGAGAPEYFFFHDPANRVYGTATDQNGLDLSTSLIINAPFRLSL